MKNTLTWRGLVGILLLALVIVGCSSNDDPSEAEPIDEAAVVDEEPVAEDPPDLEEIEAPVEIEFWTLLTGPLGERLDTMISDYNASQDNVVVVNVNQGGYNEIQQKMLAALAAGDPTYVATMIDYKNVPFYANSGVLEPISDWASDEDMEDFIPGLLADLTLEDKVYGLPMNRSTQGLYYNKDLFAAAGLDPEAPPQTWDEVREYGQAIAALGDEFNGTYGTGNMQWYFEPFVYEFGGEFSDAECNFTFNDESGVAAATYLQNLIHEDGAAIIPANLSGPFDQQMSEFVQGNIGMIRQSTAVNGFISDVVDFDWGFTMFPEGPAGRAVTGGGANVAIGAHATAEEKAAAWDFVRFLTNAENSAGFHMATGYMPSRYSAAELPEVTAFYEDHPTWKISVDQLEFARPTSCAVLNSPQWASVIESSMDRILINNEDVQTVLDEAAAELNEALESTRADGPLIKAGAAPEAEAAPAVEEASEPVEIEFWTLLTGPLGERLDTMINDYNASQDNVVVVNVNQGGYNEIQQKMLAALAAGAPTYVATMIDYKNVPFYANSGVLEPISDWASDEDMEDFIPGLLADLTLEDKVYGLPMNRSTQGLYYNKDLFAAAGLDPEAPPQTWDEVREYGQAIAALGDEFNGTYGTGNMQWYFEPFVYEFGGEFSDAECNFTFNDESGVAAATYLQNLIHEDGAAIIPANLSGPFDQQMSEFVQGNIGMIRQSTAVNGFISDVVDFDWGFTMFPEGPAGRAVTGGGANVAIGAHATAEEKAAAWDFVRFLTNAENSAGFHMATGYMPSRYSAAELPEVTAFYEDHPTWKISVDQLEFARPTSCAVLNSPQWASVIESSMDRILINNEDVQTVLDEAAAELNEALEDVRADGNLIQK